MTADTTDTPQGNQSLPEPFKFTIPAQHVEAFRAGVLAEVGQSAGTNAEAFRKASEEDLYELPDRLRKHSWEDYRGWQRYLAEAGKLLTAAFEQAEGDLSIEVPPEPLYHSLHEMAHQFTAPLTTEALDSLPPEPEKIKPWMAATGWVLDALPEVEKAMGAANRARAEAEKREGASA